MVQSHRLVVQTKEQPLADVYIQRIKDSLEILDDDASVADRIVILVWPLVCSLVTPLHISFPHNSWVVPHS